MNLLTKGPAEEQLKRNNLEQYGRREMIEISGIPHEQNEDCIGLAHQVCKLAAADIKKKRIEIAHRIKNGDIIVKSTDRPTHDQLHANRVNLKANQSKALVFTTKHQYTSMSLYHLTPKDYFTKSGKNARPLVIRKSLLIMGLSNLTILTGKD